MAYLGDIQYLQETPYEIRARKKWASSLQDEIYRRALADRRQYIDLLEKRSRAFQPIGKYEISGLGEGSGRGVTEVTLGNITSSIEDTEQAADFAQELITQLGHDRGQLDMWLALGIGDLVPPGYEHNEGDRISYEMLTAQRDNWAVAVDRTLATLVEQGTTLLLKIINTLDLMISYLLEAGTPDREAIIRFRDQLTPIVNAAETVATIAKTQLQEVLAAYRERLKRLDIDLEKLGIPPLNPSDPPNWIIIALAALAAYTVLK